MNIGDNMLEQYKNKIIHADCMNILKELPDNSIDLVVTDVPYQIKVSHSAGAFGVKKRMHYEKELLNISNGISDDILKELCRVMKKINIYVFCSKEQIPQMLNFFLPKKCNWQIISWHKTNPIPACGNSWMPDTEFCLFFREKGVFLRGNPKSKKTYYVSSTNKIDKQKYKHPTPKPIDIIKNFIINSSSEGDIVLDPYSGSGTTAVACANLNRNFICIEKDETYYNVSLERVKNETAQQTLFCI